MATARRLLKPGWNVISFTYLPNDKSVSNVMSGLTFGTDYNQVSTWDSASGTWKHWVNDSQFNDFTEFSYGKTYEIYNKTGVDKTLSVTGITNGSDLNHNVVSGDNFISPAVKSAVNVTTVLSGLTQGTHYSDVKRFNATTQAWESYVGGAFTQFEPGKGYNIVGLTSCSFSYGKTETVTTFVYDSTGQRVKKTTGATTTTYLGKDYDITGSTATKYIFLGDRRLATKDSTGVLQFIHEDHISSSNVITDASGNQAGLLEYDPYGSTVTQTGASDPKHKFTGQEKDDSTKLYYYGARYYDPQLGRFITPDWIIQDASDPQFLNRYTYCRNNPVRYTDPTGNFLPILAAFIGKVIVGALIGAAVGAAISAADAAINGRDIGKAALMGAKMGAMFGAGFTGLYAIAGATPFLAATLKPALDVVSLGLSGFSFVESVKQKNYVAAAFSAVAFFKFGKDIRADLQAKQQRPSLTIDPQNKEYPVSGGGNAKVEQRLQNQQDSTLAPASGEANISFAEKLPDGMMSTIDRISSGVKLPHRNDGSVFFNREGLLPKQPAGYYREYVVPTPGVSGPGASRVVTGQGGEMYFTADHYKTFTRLKVDAQK